MDFPLKSESNRFAVVSASVRDSLLDSLSHWWLTNQLWIVWLLLLVPLALELVYGTYRLPYLVLVPISILATYLIYRSARNRLQSKTNEIEALGQLHLATAEA